MGNKQYIQILESSKNGEYLTPKFIEMNCLQKFVIKIITPIIESRKDLLQKDNERIHEQLEKLSSKLEGLSVQVQKDNERIQKQLQELSNKYEELSEKTEVLLTDYNTKKSSVYSKYKAAIDVLCSLNLKFCENVPTFGKANKLDLLEKLVYYLYHPNNDLHEDVLASSQDFEKSKSIIDDIDNFNGNYRSDFVNYLSDIDAKWEDCVQFPSTKVFNSQIMNPYNEVEIEEGDSVYIVSLGFAFPNSNSEKQLPNVFKRRIE